MTTVLPPWGRLLSSLLATFFLASCDGENSSASSQASAVSSSAQTASQSSYSSSSSAVSSSIMHSSSVSAISSVAGSSSSDDSTAIFYRGVDLSYVNQMEDCGAVYYDGVTPTDPYLIFADRGANLVRLRLWHNPDWQTANPDEDINTYSTLADVKLAIARAKAQGLDVLLDFHYSDTWADPGRQDIPAAWAQWVEDTETLAQTVYDYTYDTLSELDDAGLMPELVQVGNETNGSVMLLPGQPRFPIDWERNAALLNAGIAAVRAAGDASSVQPKVMLHIAEPENVLWWFTDATQNGVIDFDIIGISYYTTWSDYSIAQTSALVEQLVEQFEREVIIVETAVNWTENGIDDANDIVIRAPGVAVASPQTQADWLITLTREIFNRGGSGVVYWEPAWVSTPCYTQWGQGSHWEVNTFFDFEGRVIEDGGIRFLSYDYTQEVQTVSVTFRVDLSGVDSTSGAFITGSFSGADNWVIMPMIDEGNHLFSITLDMPPGTNGAYYFLNGDDWADRETVPAECADMWDVDRRFDTPLTAGESVVLAYGFGSCTPLADD